MNRRGFLGGLAGWALACLSGARAANPVGAAPRPRIGAIRWDAWYDPADGSVAKAVEKSLGPGEFHYRMPFFGQETGPESVRIVGDTQEIIDAEIAAAAGAGLAFWAYCAYAPENPMSNALRLHLSSAHRLDIPFCLITGFESSISYFKKQTEYELSVMREPGYMTVLDGRPLYFLLSSADDQMARSGGIPKIREKIEYMRTELQRTGHGNPYFVLSEGNPARAVKLCHALDLDAVGLYATALGPFGGAPYAELAKITEGYWDKLAATGLPLVPNIMTGWDTRPRLRNPTPWSTPSPHPPSLTHFYQQAQPGEIGKHIADAVAWLEAHPAQAPAQIGLIYAWNECDEGFGALVPTYDPHHPAGNRARLDEVTAALKGA